jgi:diguanylate cyclase (GGDEF)-like protein/PAS domain S-box-containing protein
MKTTGRDPVLPGARMEKNTTAIRDQAAWLNTQDALLITNALQKAIFNSANFSSIATDAKGVIQIFNVGAEHMLGYMASDVLSRITPADISDQQELIERAAALSTEFGTPIAPGFDALVFKAAHGIEDIYELTYLRKDGSRLPAAVSVTALRDALDGIIGYLLIGTDNTARKRIEAAQEELDRRLLDQQFYTRALVESNIDAMIATDPDGIITDVNKQMEVLTGRPRDKLIGTPFNNYFTDPVRAAAAIKLVLEKTKVTDYELTARAADGKETIVSYNANTFIDRQGKLSGVFADARDITKRKQVEQQILDLAFHDTLTKLPNRRLLDERLKQEISITKRNGRYGALIFLDLDNFKSLNDTHGHGVGDLLLIEVAHRISSCVRAVDFVARFGGDEFVVIIGDLTVGQSKSAALTNVVAEKIRTSLSKSYNLKVKSDGKAEAIVEHRCTSSLGVALFLNHSVSSDEVIRCADIAMYQAKEAGGNSIRYYEAKETIGQAAPHNDLARPDAVATSLKK